MVESGAKEMKTNCFSLCTCVDVRIWDANKSQPAHDYRPRFQIAYFLRPEVPCSHVVGYAKKSLADAAGSASVVNSCPVIRGMVMMGPGNAEQQIHPLLQKHKLALPVEISEMTADGLEGYPRLKILDFLQHMADSGNVHRLLGGKRLWSCHYMLEEFWTNYQQCHPDFGLFQCSDIDYGHCIPVYAHADGGRGFKKSELMVFNWSSAIGSGTGKVNLKDPGVRSMKFRKGKQKRPQQVNLLGHSYETHYMWGVMPAAWHKDDSKFHRVLEEFGNDFMEAFEKGIYAHGIHFRLVLLGLKADLKLQARAGRLTRWYSTCRKSPINPEKPGQTQGLCCWLCGAGQIGMPFEEVHSENPAWFQHLAEWADTPPWLPGQECGLMLGSLSYTSHPAKFFLPDLFHIYLAGFGQDHAASCLVYMLGTLFDGSSVEVQLETLNSAWRLWKKMFHVSTHTYNFNRNMLNFIDSQKVFPTGTWSKASDTPKILNFIVYICSLYEEKVSQDRILSYIENSCKSIGICMKGFYDADLFMETCSQMNMFHFLVYFWGLLSVFWNFQFSRLCWDHTGKTPTCPLLIMCCCLSLNLTPTTLRKLNRRPKSSKAECTSCVATVNWLQQPLLWVDPFGFISPRFIISTIASWISKLFCIGEKNPWMH